VPTPPRDRGLPPVLESHEEAEREAIKLWDRPKPYYAAANDPVNPDHYKGKLETIDMIQATLPRTEFVGFCMGNALKYLSRAGKKGLADTDIRKAIWYLRKLIGEDPRS